MLLSDYEIIQYVLPRDFPYVNIYPFGDAHIGSKTCNEKQMKKWRDKVLSDPYGVTMICGDILDCSVKQSKGNCYDAVYSPEEQKEVALEFLNPLAKENKILGGTGGNHEYRLTREVGTKPLYGVFRELGLGHLYRENMALFKISVGEKSADKRKQVAYGVCVTHGATPVKHLKFAYAVDGCDLFISGHTHTNVEETKGKLKLDLHNNVARIVPFENIVVIPFQEYGDYAIRGEYVPNFINQYQSIKLNGRKKEMEYKKIIGC